MKNLFFPQSKTTPLIDFKIQTKIFIIKGAWNNPEKVIELRDIINYFLNEYFENIVQKTVFEITMSSISDSYGKSFYDVIKNIDKHFKKGRDIEINWYYKFEDEDFKEIGEDFKAIFKIPFNLCPF